MAATPQLKTAKLTMGPVLFNWSAEQWRDFHFRVADEAAVDAVHLGEVVCAKRLPFIAPHIDEVAQRLAGAGKQVVFSTLALVMSGQDREAVRRVAGNRDGLVEANDAAALAAISGRPHVIGPFINTYNEDTLAFFAARGALRVCPPPELPMAALAVLAEHAARLGVELEAFAFGRAPLAVSARCYHARLRGLTKSNCRFVCAEDPDGLDLRTLDDQPFLAVNGVQTLSHACINLIGDLDALVEIGVGRLRLSPHSGDMVAVAEVFRRRLDGEIDAREALDKLAALGPEAPFANGFLHQRPGMRWVGDAAR